MVGGAAGIVLGGLAGCGTPQAGSAAIIGNSAINQGRLEQVTQNYLASLDAKQRATASGRLQTVQTTILTELVLERLVGDAAAQAGVTVPDSAVSQQVQQAVASSGDQLDAQLAQNSLTRARLPDLLRVNLQVFAIGRKGAPDGITQQQAAQRAIAYITDPARKLPVTINPRYGSWTGVAIEPGNGSLSRVGAQPTTGGSQSAADQSGAGGQGGS